MTISLYMQTAQSIENAIRTAPGDFALPSLNALATQYGVSFWTASKAVDFLVARGLLVKTPDGAVAVAESLSGLRPGAALRGTAGSVCSTIRNRISDGTYAVGARLPKGRYFALTDRVSLSTVSKALNRLCRDGLIHKQGKQWIVGSAPQSLHSRPAIRREPDAVLLIVPGMDDWFVLFSIGFTQSYIIPFRNELSKYDLRIQIGLGHPSAKGPLGLLSGIDQLRAWAEEQSSRFRGTFVQSTEPQQDGLRESIPQLCRLGKPVVFFDSADRGAGLTRQSLGLGSNYYRVRIDEQAAVEQAIAAIESMGHIVVGTHGFNYAPWACRRLAVVKDTAARLHPSMRIVVAEPAEAGWDFVSVDYSQQISSPSGLPRVPHEPNAPARAELMRTRQSLPRMLIEHAPTALICPNDDCAREQYLVLRALGVRVPEDISLISFDDTPRSALFPVSTVDFDLARLGYLSAHILIGDLSVANRLGIITGVPRVLNRGSLAAPSRDKGRFRRVIGRA